MTQLIATEAMPLRMDGSGVIRVSNTRVTLDTILLAFAEGATAEEIAQQYPSVPLADVYQVIGYYLHHSAELDEYIRERSEAAERVRMDNETRSGPIGVRQRLMVRRRPSTQQG